MKNFTTTKLANRLSLSLTILASVGLVGVKSATAASFTVGGFTWDSANSVTTGSIIQGGESVFAFPTGFPGEANQTIGSILGLAPGSTSSVSLGNDSTRGIIELGWGGQLLRNLAGKDLVLYETGSWTAPEVFAVAVRKAGTNSFSEFRYQFSEGYESSAFVTGFDLSDFGLGEGEAIDAIRISNLLPTDQVSGADGQGFLGGSYSPLTGAFGAGEYADGRFDPDITAVFGLHNVVAPTPPDQKSVPEPTSVLALLAFGAVGAGCLRKRQPKNA